jgi:hypothetical protein
MRLVAFACGGEKKVAEEFYTTQHTTVSRAKTNTVLVILGSACTGIVVNLCL